WQLDQAVEGMAEACRTLDTPVIGGNVSLYNESNGQAIYPTPVVGMVGLIEKPEHITTSFAKQAGDVVFLLGETKAEFGGSALQMLQDGKVSGHAPALNLEEERQTQKALLHAIREGLVTAAHDVSEGGFAAALPELVFGTWFGVDVTIDTDLVTALFSESQSRFLVTVDKAHAEAFASMTNGKAIGTVTETSTLVVRASDRLIEMDVKELERVWEGAIPCYMTSEA
ncbi:MAG: phosphoribosylformylglycinamidine synthase II, partial [Exiguobacterium sp.]|nr:phosphoribosylformylglycinamidine synthase II [Exiguobacterium sp.]